MTTETNKRILVTRLFSEVWEQRKLTVLSQILSPSLKDDDNLFNELALRKEYLLLVDVVHKLVGPLKIEVLHFLESNDWASVRFSITAPGPEGNTPVDVEGLLMVRFEEGLIAELISQIDCFKLFEQLGQLPDEALLACLAGQKLTWA